MYTPNHISGSFLGMGKSDLLRKTRNNNEDEIGIWDHLLYLFEECIDNAQQVIIS